MATMKHRFDEAGLGKPPYTYVGFDKYPSGCQYCGTYIVRRFHLDSSDGKRFYVGCECILRKGDDPAHYVQSLNLLERMVKEAKAKIAKELKDERDAKTVADLLAIVDPNGEPVKRLKNLPHPYPYYAQKGKTYLDYVDHCYCWSNTQAKVNLYKKIRVALEGPEYNKGNPPPKEKKERKQKNNVDNCVKNCKMGLVPKQPKERKMAKQNEKWDNYYNLVEQYVASTGNLPSQTTSDAYEKKLNAWCNNQRQARRKGKLVQEREQRLEGLSNWYWRKNKKNTPETQE